MTEIQTPETNAVPTETNAVPYFPHQAPAPVPLTKRRWFLPVALAAAVLVGAGGTSAVAGSMASARAANCKAAFGYADTVMDASGNVITLLGNGLESVRQLDVNGLERISDDIDVQNNRLDGLPAKYAAARDLCE